MFTVKDLEVYKDSLKEKKASTKKRIDKSSLQTPIPLTRLSKPPLKQNNDEPLKERKPLSVVHKASNTIKDPYKPLASSPVVASKQTRPWQKNKETQLKSTPPTIVKNIDYKTDVQRSSRDVVPSKSPTGKSDYKNVSGSSKQSTQGAPSLSGTKPVSRGDANPSLCIECIRSQSEGAVCFIGNDGRVSACTSRAAIRLCKNLNCAANNPDYVAAIINTPKKYLISKRHLVKAQFGPRIKNGEPKSTNVHPTDDIANCEFPSNNVSSPGEPSPLNADTSASSNTLESKDEDVKLLGVSMSPSHEEMSLLHGSSGIELDDIGSQSGNLGRAEDVVVDDHMGFSFHNGETTEPESPTLLFLPLKDCNETSADSISSFHEDAESLALENFEGSDDDTNGSPMHSESKPEELSIFYGHSISSEEAEIEEPSGDVIRNWLGDEDITKHTCMVHNGNHQIDQSPTACDSQGAGANQKRIPVTTGADDNCSDENRPILDGIHMENDSCGDLKAGPMGQAVDGLRIDNLATQNLTDLAHDSLEGNGSDSVLEHSKSDLAQPSTADQKGDIFPSFHEAENLFCEAAHDCETADGNEGARTSILVQEIETSTEGGRTSVLVQESESRNGNALLLHGGGQSRSGTQIDENDGLDEGLLSDMLTTDGNLHIDAQVIKEEDDTNERVANDPGNKINITQRQRRRRVLMIQEEASKETVILRKQQMQGRKQAEEWMLNHVIEGVVHKLAPGGDGKVKILVEAFESIISHGDVETAECHNTRQEGMEERHLQLS